MDVKDTTDTRLVIDEASYKNLKGMLNSTPEDVQVALNCIKHLNKQRNYVAIAFLRRNTKCPIAKWIIECSVHIRYQESLGINAIGVVKVAYIHDAIDKEPLYEVENRKFFIMRYAEDLEKSLSLMDHVESAEVKIKIKDYE